MKTSDCGRIVGHFRGKVGPGAIVERQRIQFDRFFACLDREAGISKHSIGSRQTVKTGGPSGVDFGRPFEVGQRAIGFVQVEVDRAARAVGLCVIPIRFDRAIGEGQGFLPIAGSPPVSLISR